MQGSISKVFELNPPLQEESFQLRPCWKKLSLYLERNMRLNVDKSEQNKNLDSWECSDFDAKDQRTEFYIESFFLSVRLLIVTLLKEIKTVVTQKHNFDKRDESFLVTTFW